MGFDTKRRGEKTGGVDLQEIERLIMKPTARRRLGKYVLLGRLGAGGMGKIYLAYAPGPAGIEKLLVVKRLHSHLAHDSAIVNSFLDEARLSMALNHPNIGHTYDVGDVDGRTFLVMEYIEGQNLGVLLRTAKRAADAHTPYPSSSLWGGLFSQVLEGLHAAHIAKDARGRVLQIIHRDVSPQNVLITYDGVPKLVDFGIAKAHTRITGTDAGTLKGKYAYMSPEQIRGEELDARSDVFAAGIVLWEMLAGRRLYKAESAMRSVERILQEPLVSPVRVNPACSPTLADVALRALQKDRDHRFGSALEMRDALDDALELTHGVRYRREQLQTVMQSLFGDVMHRQRTILEMCLTQASANPIDDDDVVDEDERRTMDSQSDVRIPELRAKSSTTPSMSSRSGVVSKRFLTADGVPSRPVHSEEAAATTPGHSRFLLKQTPATPVPGHVDTSAPTSLGYERPRSAGHGDVAVERTTSFAVARADNSVPGAPRRNRERLLWVAALVTFLVCVPLLFLLWPKGAVVATPLPGEPAPPTSTPRVDVAIAAPPALPSVEDMPPAEPRVVPVLPTTPPPVANNTPVRPRVDPPRSNKNDRPDKPDKPDSKLDKPDVRPDNKDAPTENGFLTLDSVPWTVVYLNGKRLGETPLIRLPVPAGTLELSLVNNEAGVKETYIAKVKSGTEYKARLDLKE
jgi:eukaryotic-like serine/threonine-protein kinase